MSYILEMDDEDCPKKKAKVPRTPTLRQQAYVADMQKKREENPVKPLVLVKKANVKDEDLFKNSKKTYIILGDTYYEISEEDAKRMSNMMLGRYVYQRFGRDALFTMKIIRKGQVQCA